MNGIVEQAGNVAAASRRFVAVVQFGADENDRGVVFEESDGLWVGWPDGHADVAYRDRRGHLWDEYGDTGYVCRDGKERRGTRLPIVSRARRDAPFVDLPDASVHRAS